MRNLNILGFKLHNFIWVKMVKMDPLLRQSGRLTVTLSLSAIFKLLLKISKSVLNINVCPDKVYSNNINNRPFAKAMTLKLGCKRPK